MNQLMGNSKQLLFLAIICVLLLAAIIIYWIQPALDDKERIEYQLADTQSQITQLEQQLSQAGNNPEVDKIRFAALRKQVPEQLAADQLMFDTRSLELVTGLPVPGYFWSEEGPVSVGVQNAQGRSAQVNVVPLTFAQTFTGTFDQLSRYLTEIKDMTRVMRVRELSMTTEVSNPIKLSQANRELTVNVLLETFYAPDLARFQTDPVAAQEVKPFNVKSQPFE